MITPYISQVNIAARRTSLGVWDEQVLTSKPVKAIIWACRTLGMAIKVIRAGVFDLRALRRRSRGFWTVVVWAVATLATVIVRYEFCFV